MGETAENVAQKHKISRTDQDAFALRAIIAPSAPKIPLFAEEIVPISAPGKKVP